MKGHWIGIFTAKENETQIDFTENVIPKKWFMKPFVKTYLKKQQKQFVLVKTPVKCSVYRHKKRQAANDLATCRLMNLLVCSSVAASS